MDSEIVGSNIEMGDDMTVDEASFGWAVENAIRSSTPSILGSSRVPSFASVIDSAIRSRTPSNLGTFPVHSFASAVDMGSVATRLSQAVSKATGNVAVDLKLFTMSELVAATNNFSTHYKIGAGSFGVVYKGYLADNRVVAIKRCETGSMMEFQQNESAFLSELVLSRLNHKHLIRLVGFCENEHERILVYEYMEKGDLYDLLREKGDSVLNNWKMRIKIALDASRGIEYLHDYAVPSIIHKDIKSSHILLDANWTARVSGFGMSLNSPESNRPMKAVGTVGYIDPEYYALNVLTTKSDVYGFGIVLLELLTGKRAIFKYDDGGGTPMSVVDFAVPAILADEFVKILDPRVGPPDVNEAEAVAFVAYTAMNCVNLERKDRPTMADIVVNLKRALDIFDSSYDSISSGTISVVSE